MILDPAAKETVESARLRYVSDEMPGIRRLRSGRGFRYLDANAGRLKDPDVLSRIRSLAIPPAWTNVWICPSERGHIQATGRDARARKQYLYHSRWREYRDSTKYDRLSAFGLALPALRARLDQALSLTGLPREKILATIVKLLELTLIRIGNEEYQRANGSYGLTTLRGRHVRIEGSTVRFQFQGKSGIKHSVDVNDRRIARIIRYCQDLPGQELFQYLDDDGQCQSIDSADVNEFLREITGEDFTAKDFRTWAGTVNAVLALTQFEMHKSESEARRNIVQAMKAVATRLGNTPAVCRKSYVHPAILDLYVSGTLLDLMDQKIKEQKRRRRQHLELEEAAVLALLLNLESTSKTKSNSSGRS